MIIDTITFLQNTIIPLGSFGVFLAGFIQEIVPTLPSALFMMFTGFFFLEGEVSIELIKTLIFTVVIPLSLGLSLGSLFMFYLSFIFGKSVIEKWGKYIALKWGDIEKLKSKLKGTYVDELMIIFFRSLPIVPATAVSVYCGIIRMNVFKYLILTFIGTIFRSTILVILGWQVGNLYYVHAALVEKLGTISIILVVLVFISYRIYKKKVVVKT